MLRPSFPHAFSGNPGEFRTGPPTKTFGGDYVMEIFIISGQNSIMNHFVVTKFIAKCRNIHKHKCRNSLVTDVLIEQVDELSHLRTPLQCRHYVHVALWFDGPGHVFAGRPSPLALDHDLARFFR